jgi:thiamine transport system permease protein
MARRHQPVNRHWTSFIAAWLATIIILALACLPLLALVSATEAPAGDLSLQDPYILRILRFTLVQAALSAMISVALAIPVSRALARRQHFPGRGLLLRIFAVPLGLPQLVIVLGIIAVYGRQGVLNSLLSALDLPIIPAVFGLKGILLAHVFFNMPLAVRFLLARLEAIPQESWRLAESLGFGATHIFRYLEWPQMRSVMPGVAALIFMLCVTSFTVVLTLGGGPRATTLEVAIYQALRFDFNPALAARLAGLQIALCAVLLVLLQRFSMTVAIAPRLKVSTVRPDSGAKPALVSDVLLILGAAVFVLLPLVAIVIDGAKADFARLASEPTLWRALRWSALIAGSASLLATALSVSLASGMARSSGISAHVFRLTGNLVLLMPPIVLAAGSFLLVYRHVDPQKFSPYAVIIINALMALPFALPVLEPALKTSFQAHDRLAASLGLKGLARFRLVEWPVLRPSLALGLLVALLVSIGEFGVIAFFGNQDLVTLPLFLYQRIGSYRFNDAAGLALLLMLLCLIISGLIERKARGDVQAGP